MNMNQRNGYSCTAIQYGYEMERYDEGAWDPNTLQRT